MRENQYHTGLYSIFKNGKLVLQVCNTLTTYYRTNLFAILDYKQTGTASNIKIHHFKVGRNNTPAVETDTDLLSPYNTNYTPTDSTVYSDYLFTYFIIPTGDNLVINEIGVYNSQNNLLSRVALDIPISKGPNDEIIIQRKDIIKFTTRV